MKSNQILLFHNMAAIKIRVENILGKINVKMIDAGDKEHYYNLLEEADNDALLAILDLPRNPEASMEMISRTRKQLKNTPIIVLTNAEKEKFYFEALLKGATDFVIKPFLDQTLVSKVNKYIETEGLNQIEFITMDFSKYIKGELRKAEKGEFPLSLLLLNLENTNSESEVDPKLAALLFDNLQDLFWDTDIFIKFASKYYMGVFPFCSVENTKIIVDKMQARFSEIKTECKELTGYNMVTSFCSYPHDTEDTSQILKILIERIGLT